MCGAYTYTCTLLVLSDSKAINSNTITPLCDIVQRQTLSDRLNCASMRDQMIGGCSAIIQVNSPMTTLCSCTASINSSTRGMRVDVAECSFGCAMEWQRQRAALKNVQFLFDYRLYRNAMHVGCFQCERVCVCVCVFVYAWKVRHLERPDIGKGREYWESMVYVQLRIWFTNIQLRFS